MRWKKQLLTVVVFAPVILREMKTTLMTDYMPTSW